MFRTPLNVGVLNGDDADLPFCTMSALVCAHAPPSSPGWPKRGRVPTRLCGPTVGIHHRGIERAVRVVAGCFNGASQGREDVSNSPKCGSSERG